MKKLRRIKKRFVCALLMSGTIGVSTLSICPPILNAATIFTINNDTEEVNARGTLNRLKTIYGDNIDSWPEPSKSEGKAIESALKLYQITKGTSGGNSGNNSGGNSGNNSGGIYDINKYSTEHKTVYYLTVNYNLKDDIIGSKVINNISGDISFVGNHFYTNESDQFLLEEKPELDGNEIIGWKVPTISSDMVESSRQSTSYNDSQKKKIITTYKTATVDAIPIYKYRTITFTDENGNVLKTQNTEYGEELQAPEVEERETQKFKGWNVDLENARYSAGDITIKQVWEDKNQYTVRFYDDDYRTLLKEETVYEGGKVSPPVVEKEGYKFRYWNLIGGIGNESYNNVKGNYSYRAVYDKLYLITFTDGDGNVLSKQYVEYGSEVKAPSVPQKRGYLFSRWDKGDYKWKWGGYLFQNVSEDMTINAEWIKLPVYEITFEDDNGNVIKTEKLYAGEPIETTEIPEAPKRDGEVFDYWSDKDKPSYSIYNKAEKDVTFVPVYRNYAIVKFTSGDPFEYTLSESEVEYGKSAVAPENPELYRYIFSGWDKDFDVVTEDLEVHALWEKEWSADYTEIDNVISSVPDDLSIYTTESVENLKEKLDSATRVNESREYTISEQQIVDDIANELTKAIEALTIKPLADYTDVDKWIKYAKEKIETGEYTDESIKKLEDIINSVEYGKYFDEQNIVNAYERALYEAQNELEYKPLDFSKLDEFLKTLPSDEELDKYTEYSVQNLKVAIENALYVKENASEMGYRVYNTEIVDNHIENIQRYLLRLERVEEPEQHEEPTEPTNPEQPTEPMEPTEPEKPTDEPTTPAEPDDKPIEEPTTPSQPEQPSEPSNPTNPVNPTEPTQPQPTAPAEPEQPEEPTKPVQPIDEDQGEQKGTNKSNTENPETENSADNTKDNSEITDQGQKDDNNNNEKISEEVKNDTKGDEATKDGKTDTDTSGTEAQVNKTEVTRQSNAAPTTITTNGTNANVDSNNKDDANVTSAPKTGDSNNIALLTAAAAGAAAVAGAAIAKRRKKED